ncbi:PilT protein domain protein [Methylocella silvestris BL2]|uniref:Ribonuclease VapC n=1 Tax=Methylocella silvestris (strain DSM 15510 / CIP 108128 / LMG 27833 / NCIMB 13906 / BL2) TaxID=395965 RepID=B8EP85_METSB|nr:type II toxin-antitoxin system VapC family toxin [Methylocella silvestris]ACK49673.1 PilT protein domain protein [Methylocella silvestris BL2]
MTIFVDASALIAIILEEKDATELADRLEDEAVRLCSGLSVWETVAGLCRARAFSIPGARVHVRRFIEVGGFKFVAIGEEEYEIAAEAYAQYGKGRHPAALNMGDCFAYACAKANRAHLLFKGNDFAMTDFGADGRRG